MTRPRRRPSAGGGPPAPLDGVRVLDLTRNLAGPLCTMLLADYGAEVIKVEHPARGDEMRRWKSHSWPLASPAFLAVNRSKRSLAVDLDRPDGAAIVRALAVGADVLVENFRCGSLDRRGLGPDELCRLNPKLVYASITGFGSVGSLRDRPGYDPIMQAYAGIISVTGDAGGPPVRVAQSIIDIAAGSWCAMAIMAGLMRRTITGVGGRVETSLLEAAVALSGMQVAMFAATGQIPQRMGSQHAISAPNEAFATAEGHLFIATPNENHFRRLCAVLGCSELADDKRFRSNADRIANRSDLHTLLEARLMQRSASEWEVVLTEAEVPASRVRSIDEVVADPQLAALGLLLQLHCQQGEEEREVTVVDLPVTLDGVRSVRPTAPPGVGEDTDKLLETLLGYDGDAISRLRAQGVIA